EYNELKRYFLGKKGQSILFLPADPQYTFINKNLMGINTPDSNIRVFKISKCVKKSI
ncbi:unnamed protein product, partial [marine sediment metagenome]